MPVVADYGRITALGLKVFEEALLARGRVIRHEPDLLAEAVYKTYRRGKTGRAGAEGRVSRQ